MYTQLPILGKYIEEDQNITRYQLIKKPVFTVYKKLPNLNENCQRKTKYNSCS